MYEKKCKYRFLHGQEIAYRAIFTIFDANVALVEPETAPSGMLARGHYNAVSKFVDDDDNTHLKFEWSFDIKKDW